ncbi:hypothetical protein D3C77_706570 [compost metagenome]
MRSPALRRQAKTAADLVDAHIKPDDFNTSRFIVGDTPDASRLKGLFLKVPPFSQGDISDAYNWRGRRKGAA